MKYKITIRRLVTEDYEMVLENENVMAAFDEARRQVAARNERSKIGKYSVIKIENLKEESNGSPDHVSEGELCPEPPAQTSCCG